MRSDPLMKDSWEFSAKEFVKGKVLQTAGSLCLCPQAKTAASVDAGALQLQE